MGTGEMWGNVRKYYSKDCVTKQSISITKSACLLAKIMNNNTRPPWRTKAAELIKWNHSDSPALISTKKEELISNWCRHRKRIALLNYERATIKSSRARQRSGTTNLVQLSWIVDRMRVVGANPSSDSLIYHIPSGAVGAKQVRFCVSPWKLVS